MSWVWRRLSLALCVFLLPWVRAQQPPEAKPVGLPAFPGAMGFGAMTPGGRGGKIIEVTNLNDAGPGSLREACFAEGPRIVVFRVAGIIDLQDDIKISQPFLTIAGQSAPGDGICLRNATLRICTHDVVLRFIRARVGDGEQGAIPDNRDALKIEGTQVHHVIVDHCSTSWSIDENVSTWGTPHDVTVQWCIIAEALSKNRHPKGVHSMGLLAGAQTTRFTFHHNLLAHNGWRNPLLHGRGEQPSEYDFTNNVVYDFGKFCSVIRGRTHVRYVGNYIRRGPSSEAEQEVHIDLDIKNDARPLVFLADNIGPSNPDGSADNWRMVLDMAKLDEATLRTTTPFAFPDIAAERAQTAFEAVLNSAGATRPRRDAVDTRIVADVRNGTGKVIDSPKDVGGWPEYKPEAPAEDADHDGMPDEWEKAHGLNPADAADGAKDNDGDGYTNVEEFLNDTAP
ncbi:MAG: hypothetical protein A3K19_10940 [Lentisphaerae bacterium RIFOXYB12_FULL_65_16]|nr:MAG: hypothetical protein A3K18_18145 [Lentisphaerae bacterium RIFOXYA12_64_32]OGV87858.1 MAG: hypothetical protein A3K19_10940 [Lentisphaerae bacterium RIFOXYB12_FULL_65_16]